MPSTEPRTYFISYGLAGGRLHAREFIRQMRTAGFMPAEPQKADILIAHSGGCWMIPETVKPRLVIYVGMCLPQPSLRHAFHEANRNSLRRSHFTSNISTKLKSILQTLRRPRRNFRMVRMAKHARPVIFPRTDTVFVANHNDLWPNSKAQDDYVSRYDWSFIGMEGAHDDIWDHPGRYVELIRRYAGLLG